MHTNTYVICITKCQSQYDRFTLKEYITSVARLD